MKTIAELQAEEAADLSERLKSKAIPVEVRPITQEGGLDMSELLVEDIFYERACDAADSWQTERLAEAEKRCTWSCPKCKSRRLECIPNDKVEYMFRCKDCGSEFITCGPPSKPSESRPVGAGRSASQSTVSRPALKLTIFIVSLTVATFFLGWLVTQFSHTFHPALFWAYFLSSIVCLERGRYILKRDRLLGWLCIVIGIIPLIMVWVVIFRHEVKIHT
jgi:hypothetical protein